MPLKITARNVELSDGDKAHIEEKVDRFRKLVDEISVLDVVVTHQKGLYTADVVVKARRYEAAAAETHNDLRTAIDRAIGKVERQLQKQIEKMRTRKRHSREARERRRLTLSVPVAGDLPRHRPRRARGSCAPTRSQASRCRSRRPPSSSRSRPARSWFSTTPKPIRST